MLFYPFVAYFSYFRSVLLKRMLEKSYINGYNYDPWML